MILEGENSQQTDGHTEGQLGDNNERERVKEKERERGERERE